MNEKVSVIITCCNHEKYIEQCIRSIFSQAYKNIELLVINDGSQDNSGEIIEKALINSPFKVTKYIYQENKGACVSRNRGLDWAERSDSDFVLMVDSDNYLEDNHIEKELTLLNETGKDIAYSSLKDAETGTIYIEVPQFSFGRLVNVNYIDTCSLIRKSVIKSHRFDTYLNRLFMQDYDFFLGLIYDGAQAIKAESLYQNYRILQGSLGNRTETVEKRVKWFEVYHYIIRKYANCNTATSWLSNWYMELYNQHSVLTHQHKELTCQCEELIHQCEELTQQHNELAHQYEELLAYYNKVKKTSVYHILRYIKRKISGKQ